MSLSDSTTIPLLPSKAYKGPQLWVTNDLTVGGVERQIIATAACLPKETSGIHLLCKSMSAQGGNFFLRESLSVFRGVYSLNTLSDTLAPLMPRTMELARRICAGFGLHHESASLCASFAAFYQRFRPRSVHVWNGDHLLPVLGAVLAGVPEVVILGRSMSPRSRHPYGWESIDDVLAKELYAFLLRFPSVKLANNSNAGRLDYADWLGIDPERIFLTRNAFVPQDWEERSPGEVAAMRAEFGVPETAPVIGGLFRFTSIKDPELWVLSAGQALRRIPDAYAVLGGDGLLREGLMKAVAGTPFAQRLLFPGAVRDTASFYTMCDVFLLTSHVEGLPNVALEAQYFKLPVVSTVCGGIADVVEDGKTGLISPERSPEQLAARLTSVLRNPEWSATAGRLGRERICNVFSAEETAKSFLRIRQKTCERAGRNAA